MRTIVHFAELAMLAQHGFRNMIAAMALMAACAIVTAPSPIAAEPLSRKIVVGEGIAGINIGMTEDEVIAIAGSPVSENRQPDSRPIFLSYDPPGLFGVYFNGAGRVRLIVLARDGYCTRRKVCLGAAGQIKALTKVYGDRVLRFRDSDGTVTYRLLNDYGDRKVLTEFTPAPDDSSLVQVMMLNWTGGIADSALGGGE